jgi:uncharacterized protein (DUF488 family)
MEKDIKLTANVTNDPFNFLDKYIRPLDDNANPELLANVKDILDAYEISDLEMGIDSFGEALIEYFEDYDIIWKGLPNNLMATDEWDNELLNIVIDYKNDSIDLETTVNRFRNVLGDLKYYKVR